MEEKQDRRTLPRFLADLKRRRVFHVMAVYGAISLASLEGISLIQPILSVPDAGYRAAGWIAMLGFPLAVALAWLYDYDDHLVRTPPASMDELDALVRLPTWRRWSAGLLALLGMLFVVGAGWYAIAPQVDSTTPTVAVLPFTPRTGVAADDRFIGGLHDDILVRLSREPGVHVVSRTSTLRFADSRVPMRALADSLGAYLIVEGGVQREGDVVRITVQVIQGAEDDHAWAGTWDIQWTEEGALDAQTRIAEGVARVVRAILDGSPPPASAAGPPG